MFQGPPGSPGPPGPPLNLTLLQLKVIKGARTPDPVVPCRVALPPLPPSPFPCCTGLTWPLTMLQSSNTPSLHWYTTYLLHNGIINAVVYTWLVSCEYMSFYYYYYYIISYIQSSPQRSRFVDWLLGWFILLDHVQGTPLEPLSKSEAEIVDPTSECSVFHFFMTQERKKAKLKFCRYLPPAIINTKLMETTF